MPMVVSDPHRPDNPIVLANQAFLDMTGYSPDEVIGQNCRFLQGPDTDPEAISEIRRAVAAGREITIELLNYGKHGKPFWNQLLVSPIHDSNGDLLYFFASQLDVTRRREALALEQAEHRLLREVDHRAKNALALVQGIVRLTRADDAQSYARSVQGRVDALARAHNILSEARWGDIAVERVLKAEADAFGARRITLDGAAIEIGPAQVQPLALLIHELLINAARHGALSAPDGTVSIRWERADEGRARLAWREQGGPPPGSDHTHGYGLTMIDAIARRQLQGDVSFEWRPQGLFALLTFAVIDPD